MHAAVLATLPDTSARAYTLTVGGSDMNVTGENSSAYMVDMNTIHIEEEGPGGVSGMEFDVWDPNREVVLTEMAWVEFWDVTNNLPKFKGFVGSWSSSGSVARTIRVRCVGIEAVLDWLIVPSLTVPAGTQKSTAVQSIIANAAGIGVPLRAFVANALPKGNQAGPIGHNTGTLDDAIVLSGESVREALQLVSDAPTGGEVGVDTRQAFTVDFWSGLRFWLLSDLSQFPYTGPGDYATLTIVDTVGAGIAASALDHEIDALGVPHAVFVTGGNAAGTGLVTDGTGTLGPTATLDDTAILTAAARDAAGRAYLANKAVAIRGSLTVENFAPTTNIRAGSPLVITNTVADLSAADFMIASISRRFIKTGNGIRETLGVAYGGLRRREPLRRFTRGRVSS